MRYYIRFYIPFVGWYFLDKESEGFDLRTIPAVLLQAACISVPLVLLLERFGS